MDKGQGDTFRGQKEVQPSAPPSDEAPPPPYFEGGFSPPSGSTLPFPTVFDPVPPTYGFTPNTAIGNASAMPLPPQTLPELPSDPPPTYTESNFTVNCPTSEEQVKEIILAHYADDCCFNPSSVQDLTICEITEMHAFRFALQTFVEIRTVVEKSEPYRNQAVDGPQNGPVPEKWSVSVSPPQPFVAKASFSMDLPHSGSVIACNKCHSTGYMACRSCDGMGFSRCIWCSGTGRKHKAGSTTDYESCSSCSGMGRNNCFSCQLGRVSCGTCKGHRFIKVWQNLVVNWKTLDKTHETERGELKPKHLRKAKCGETLSTRESSPLDPQPLKCSLDPVIFQVAQRLIGEELGKQSGDYRILKFRQKIGVIPVVKVIYLYKHKEGHFYVYGDKSVARVYFPGGYVGRSGCCCSIV